MIGYVLYSTHAGVQVKQFVDEYSGPLEAAIAADDRKGAEKICEIDPQIYKNEGTEMWQFTVISKGNSYYGCYYSPQDIPLPFQNSGDALTEKKDGVWTWSSVGDNHGETRRLKKGWYYFQASF